MTHQIVMGRAVELRERLEEMRVRGLDPLQYELAGMVDESLRLLASETKRADEAEDLLYADHGPDGDNGAMLCRYRNTLTHGACPICRRVWERRG